MLLSGAKFPRILARIQAVLIRWDPATTHSPYFGSCIRRRYWSAEIDDISGCDPLLARNVKGLVKNAWNASFFVLCFSILTHSSRYKFSLPKLGLNCYGEVRALRRNFTQVLSFQVLRWVRVARWTAALTVSSSIPARRPQLSAKSSKCSRVVWYIVFQRFSVRGLSTGLWIPPQ